MKFIFTICLFIILSSCTEHAPNKKRNEVRTGFDVKVTHSAGDHFEQQLDSLSYTYLPYVGNIARLKNFGDCEIDFMILSHHIRKNHSLHVIPIAILEFSEQGVKQKVVISVPENQEIRAIPVDNYDHFVVKYFSVQQIIENWYRNRLGFGMVKDVQWKNELSAIRIIEACIFE